MIAFREDDQARQLLALYSNKRFHELKGTLTQNEARLTLIEFFRYNLGFTVEYLFGIKLYPLQEYLLINWFENNFCMNVVSRGGSKSWLVAIFCLLYSIFYPGTRIVLASNVFRSSRRILEQIEKFLNAPDAQLLKQCFPNEIKRATDLWQLKTSNEGFIRALPLNEKIRGERADVLIVDEFLLVPENTYTQVLIPFLNAKNNIQDQLKIEQQENYLIKHGYLTEDQRTILNTNKKVIGLTSASYDFEFCYKIYKQWQEKAISKTNGEESGTYCTNRLSYLAIPKGLVEDAVVEEAKSGGENSPYFRREYMAIFHTGSDGFYSMAHMSACTVPDGELPCVQIEGQKDAEYILAIDPSFSSGKTSDFFAMSLFMVNRENKTITLVNSYAVAGGELKNHIAYLHYLITHFNIVLITADLLGGEGQARGFNFIQAANESSIFKLSNIELKFFEGCLDDCGEDYPAEMKRMRNTYNKEKYTICYTQGNRPVWKKRSNEYMQLQMQNKKVWFASQIIPNEEQCSKYANYKLPVKVFDSFNKELTTADFLQEQDHLIQETKNQIVLIEPKASESGNIVFDLPSAIKAIKGEKRARRDNYTTTLMACWAAKFYFDYLDENIGKRFVFRPRFVA